MSFYTMEELDQRIAIIKRLRNIGMTDDQIVEQMNDWGHYVTKAFVVKVIDTGNVSEDTNSGKQLLNG